MMDAFKALKTTISLIFGGSTGFIQALDVALNQPMKNFIIKEANGHYYQDLVMVR